MNLLTRAVDPPLNSLIPRANIFIPRLMTTHLSLGDPTVAPVLFLTAKSPILCFSCFLWVPDLSSSRVRWSDTFPELEEWFLRRSWSFEWPGNFYSTVWGGTPADLSLFSIFPTISGIFQERKFEVLVLNNVSSCSYNFLFYGSGVILLFSSSFSVILVTS